MDIKEFEKRELILIYKKFIDLYKENEKLLNSEDRYLNFSRTLVDQFEGEKQLYILTTYPRMSEIFREITYNKLFKEYFVEYEKSIEWNIIYNIIRNNLQRVEISNRYNSSELRWDVSFRFITTQNREETNKFLKLVQMRELNN